MAAGRIFGAAGGWPRGVPEESRDLNLKPPMNSMMTPLARLLLAGLLLTPALGLAQPNKSESQRAQDAQALARYDRNNNGVLDPDERAAMAADEARNGRAATAPSTGSNTATSPSVPPATNQAGSSAGAATPGSGVVELTPFTVTADNDTGYFASNTMSGTRINSKIEDLAGSITVVNKEQLLDTAALDINDVFRYEANTEGTSNYTAFSVDRSGNVNDVAQGSPAQANRIRGIDSANTAVNGFPSTSRIPIDTYNIDSVEVSRGPNSNLFGLGSAAGTVNLNIARASLQRDTTRVQFRTDDRGEFRSNLDVGRPIFKDKLAVRVAAVYDDRKFKQKPSYDLMRRAFGTFTYQPFRATTIRGSYETYHEQRRTPNSLTPRDAISEWIADGQPTWDPTNFTATVNGVRTAPITVGSGTTAENLTLPPGLYVDTTVYTRPSMFIDPATGVAIWEVNRTTSTSNPNSPNTNVRIMGSGTNLIRNRANLFPLFVAPGISNPALYDWEHINAVSTNWNRDKADIYTLELEQKLLDNEFGRAFTRLGWHLEDSDSYNRNISNPPTVYVDVNERLLDGTPNPFFKRPYIQNIEPTIFSSPEYNDNLRAELFYEYDFARQPGWRRWLGHHQLLGYYENRRITNGTYRFREAIVDPNHPWLTAGALNFTNGAAIGRPTYRYYVGDANGYNFDYGPPQSGVQGNFTLRYFNGVTGQWVNAPATFGEAPYISSQTRREITSRGIVDQSSFWNDRIVLTGGLRRDFQRSRNSNGAVVDPATGFYTYGPLDTWQPWAEVHGTTKTYGAVVKPLPWFGLSVGGSDSFQPAIAQVNLFGTQLPNPTGHDHNYGAFVRLLDGKIEARVTFYKTTLINSRAGDAGAVASRVATLESGTGGGSSFSFLTWATSVANARLGAGASQAAIDAEVARIMQLPPTFPGTTASYAETSDVSSKGLELELNYNPTHNWTNRITVARQRTFDQNLAPTLQQYIDLRLPIWTTATDPTIGPFWTGSGAQAYYNQNILTPLSFAVANQGKPRSQVKEWTWRYLTNYHFTEGKLKGLGVGTQVRWDDRSSIGFYGTSDPDGVIRTLDPSRPIWSPARYYFDLLASYDLRLFKDKVRTRIQLNVRNVNENGRLQGVGANPDGTIYNWRIIEPRQFILTTTFDF
jgi:outer membrane receptor protein involved in Fe transport